MGANESSPDSGPAAQISRRKTTAFQAQLKNQLGAEMTGSEKERSILEKGAVRRVSHDFAKRAYALSDDHFKR